MKSNNINGIRKRILQVLFYSFILSKVMIVLLLGFVLVLEKTSILPFFMKEILRFLERTFGVLPVLYVTDITLIVLFILLLSNHQIVSFVQLSRGVQELAKGKFDLKIPVERRDQLGELASNINEMSHKLELSIEEERRAVQAKNELITNVSHDLRTPLTSIIGYLDLIEKDRYKDEVDLRYYVSVAYDKSKRLERMVNDLFEYTRVSFGGLRLQLTEINLIELLGQLSAQFSPQFQSMGMEIRHLFSEEKLIILADGDKLMRVFENLVGNALKYGKEGKYVDIKVTRGQKQERATIEIVNYGQPIPSSEIPHIFERFYRIEKSRSEETGGSGLGLAIAKNIVELHRGSLTVSSDEVETIFKVTLPLNYKEDNK